MNHPVKTKVAGFTGGIIVLVSLWTTPAEAVPSFSRQTGQACSACHVRAFDPGLNQYGREFKLNGYVWGEGGSGFPPLSAMIQGSFTNTKKDIPGGPVPEHPEFSKNNNFALDAAILMYAGRVLSNVGAFVQLAYEGVEDKVAMDHTDIRFADRVDLWDQDIVYGISVNNAPTVQDLWNTTPAWGFPFVSSSLAPAPETATLIDNTLGTQVGGGSVYTMINSLLYLEAGAYTTFAKDVQKGMGTFEKEQNKIDGGATYWRIALQHNWDGHYFALGHYALRADVFPERDSSAGTDRVTDLAVDGTYQFLGDPKHIYELKGTYIREDQELSASRALGNAFNSHNTLDTFRIDASYTYHQTYGITFGYNKIWGSKDMVRFEAPDFADGRPDSEFFITELDYIPFGKTDSFGEPWLNLRFALQYVAYNQFNGTGHHAGNNNTLYLNGWLAF